MTPPTDGVEAALVSDLESTIINLEQSFFHNGFQGGVVHGRLHGLFEGRSIGKDHAWQLSEEVGYYHGFALVWAHLLAAHEKGPTRWIFSGDCFLVDFAFSATTNLRQILFLSASFPLRNNSSAPVERSELDITAMLNNQRVKYRAVCAAIGVRPRITVASAGTNSSSGKLGGGL
ncbi:BZ3500_MvSof-1268-A1-R1_Chr7-3g09571 [Microbotryum saponariae]|uniref:BZ3500_MvSof-1268-A1-R1_Chr7-3g09571 protein n=1 Tax=Microbotryum saponariae TaxID=289078 RepID=A0A2X0MTY5_9BASI|nr:BZ3501_MvSof-1269-A2-R1_Chr7-2g09294 [Microbotryum saponariae]SDA02222.1 BZ3500_MvSof-1268-A1-R1_Chr7-3g09571 [Microbotryum saponariae]